MPWATLGAAVISGAASASSQSKAAAAQGAALGKAKSWYQMGNAAYDLAGKQAVNLAKKNVGVVKQGFANAKGELQGAGYAGQQAVKQAGLKAQAAAGQGAVNSGVGGTVLQNLNQGIYYNTATQLAGIQEAIGQLMAGLDTQETGALTAANTGLSQAYGYQAATKTSQFDKIAALYTGLQYEGQSYDFGALGAALSKMDWGGGGGGDWMSKIGWSNGSPTYTNDFVGPPAY